MANTKLSSRKIIEDIDVENRRESIEALQSYNVTDEASGSLQAYDMASGAINDKAEVQLPVSSDLQRLFDLLK